MIDQNKEILKALQHLGLSEKEAQVYFALLPRRDVGSSKIVLATGLHKQFIYNALARLEELGLAKHVIQNGRKKFSASSPTRLLSILEEKKITAQSLVRDLQKRYVGAHDQDFEVFQGVNAFLAHEWASLEIVPEGSTVEVIGGVGDQYFATFGPDQEEYDALRLRKNINIRYIGQESQREMLEAWSKTRPLWTYRIFPGHSLGIIDTGIWPDSIHFTVFGEPLLSFTLTSKDVANGYREFFEAIWNMAIPVR